MNPLVSIFRSSPGDKQRLTEIRCVRPSVHTFVDEKLSRCRSNLMCGYTSTRYVHQYDFDSIQGYLAFEFSKIALF